MTCNIRLSSSAYRDLKKLTHFYTEISRGAARTFTSELEILTTRLSEFPDLGMEYETGLRRILLTRFSCWVYYRHSGDDLVIVAIFHCSRNPKDIENIT